MYDERPYGDILRDERERNGYDLNSMSRRLHIRPDILMAIERSDFDRMPARGYSKNMVRAYARALHLDERQIMDMFLDQAHLHDVGETRRPYSHGNSDRRSSRNRSYSRDISSRPYSDRRTDRDDRYSNSRSLDFDSETLPRSRRRSNYSREEGRGRGGGRESHYDEMGISRPLDRDRSSGRGSGFSAGAIFQSFANRGGRQETKVGRSFDTIGSNPPYARNNVNRGPNTLAGMNLPLLLVIVAAVIALIIIVVVVTNGSHQAAQDLPNIPISGLTDTSGTSSDSSSSSSDDVVTPDAIVLPESVEVLLEVADDQDSWVEVYENGSSNPSIAEVLHGKVERVFDVDKSIKIRTANPSAVTVSVDDEKVTLANEGNGNYSYTFNFKDYLNDWKKEHKVKDSSSSSKKTSSSKKSSNS